MHVRVFTACVVALSLTSTALATQPPQLDLIDPAFDAGYADGSTNTSIQREIACAVHLNAHGLPTTMHLADPENMGVVQACWDPSGPAPSTAELAAMQALHNTLNPRYFLNGSWSPAPGSPVTITWSFVPDGLSIPSGNGEPAANSTLFATMDSRFSTQGGRNTWIAQLESVFARWSAISGINYVRVSASGQPWDDGAAWGTAGNGTTRGDVRVSSKPIDGSSRVLAYNFFPTVSDMVLDSAENWGNSSNSFRFLRNTFAHELGHGLGFLHNCPISQSKLMEPFLSTAFDGPQQDDLRAAHANYGDAFEPNGTVANAYDLGTLVAGSVVNLGTLPAPAVANSSVLSLTSSGDRDIFKLRLNEPRLVRVVATPIGSTYNQAQQGGGEGGGCDAGTPQNSLVAANLIVTALTVDGATPITVADRTPVGEIETMAGAMYTNGQSYLRISSDSALGPVQLYTLSVQVLSTDLKPTATDATFTDKVRVTWPAIPDAVDYRLVRNTTNTAGGAQLLTTTTSNSFDDTTAQPGVTYFYFIQVNQQGGTGYRATTVTGNGEEGSIGQAECDSIDFNNDGIFPDDRDVVDFFAVLAGSSCPACNSIDFNNDGIFPDDRDVTNFFSVLAGGPCP
jgi:hypothetical protein